MAMHKKNLQYDYKQFQTDNSFNIWAMMIVWRVRGEIIWPALCFCAS